MGKKKEEERGREGEVERRERKYTLTYQHILNHHVICSFELIFTYIHPNSTYPRSISLLVSDAPSPQHPPPPLRTHDRKVMKNMRVVDKPKREATNGCKH